ncbi:MAG: bifunctional UDP-N-acetylglucosamine diphosphorylase/glucosamine-1-phosphate N-acetyltransferase GlmU [Polynucleobacter sp.]|jgi:bifunctional UDP-N-acetylglucosamine pyrophosphorylase/glucosamine-1-phosphate N-acetyltransferase|nr:bifunctional UDP-N-acetylglucosamine diphosphorylase/glucosamine-1-phosphate N-acetyltransferase GlmU [Polynucleobacter sp.]
MNIVILAAGQGKRMRSALPKVLQTLAGKPLLQYVLETVFSLSSKRSGSINPIVVLGHGAEQVKQFLHGLEQVNPQFKTVSTVLQAEQKGTGHALLQALPKLNPKQATLVLYGDVPLTSSSTLANLIRLADPDRNGNCALTLLTQDLDDPTGYGRIVRNQDESIQAIVEEKDADSTVKAIQEINTGIMVLPTPSLKAWLKALKTKNAQGEYYLTDVVSMAVKANLPIRSAQAQEEYEVIGVNSRDQLAELEGTLQFVLANQLMQDGVALADPSRIDIRGTLQCAKDVYIDVGCIFEGCVSLGQGVSIGPYCVVRNSSIGTGAKIDAFSYIDQAQVGDECRIGPYARLRPGTVLAKEVHIGNFVEVKNSTIAAHSKANHLSYVGDSTVGSRVNIGAGTITCNYDGVNKHRTVIEDDVFIGSDTQLVAPVKVGRGAILGAGTTLTKDAPPNQLTISRVKQNSIPWKKPQPKKSIREKVVSKKISAQKLTAPRKRKA